MKKDYKAEQKEFRSRAKAVKVVWRGGTFNAGIRAFKRINKDPQMRQWYKDNAWGSIKIEATK